MPRGQELAARGLPPCFPSGPVEREDDFRGGSLGGDGLSLLRALWLVWAKEFSSPFSEPQAAGSDLPSLVLATPDAVMDPRSKQGPGSREWQRPSSPALTPPSPCLAGQLLAPPSRWVMSRWESELSEFWPGGPALLGRAQSRAWPLRLLAALAWPESLSSFAGHVALTLFLLTQELYL